MRKTTFIVVLIVAALLFAIGVALQSGGGGALSNWLASLHGAPGR
jgi:hypothetical protein